MYDTPAPGSVIYAKADYFAGERRRLTKGKAYVAGHSDRSGLWIKECDAGHNCCWGTDWFEHFTTEPPAQPFAQPFTLLDDAGRFALKRGDRVLIEAEVHDAQRDKDDEIRVQGLRASRFGIEFCASSAVYALLPPAPKPIAIGDAVRIAGGSTGKVLAQASDGRWAVEYDAGGTTEVRSYDASCLEVVS